MLNRRQSILAAALACVTECGLEACTVEMIRERSGASIGSLYHHFGNKQGILAALYLGGIEDYGYAADRALRAANSPEQLVRSVVFSYLQWVEANPDWARFLLHGRSRIEQAGELGAALAEINRLHQQCFDEQLQRLGPDALKPMPRDCQHVLMFGPSHELARRWLGQRIPGDLLVYGEYLGEAAWLSLKA
jgi:AcrR family transcriptional regulator